MSSDVPGKRARKRAERIRSAEKSVKLSRIRTLSLQCF
nr:MAG TPA: hypothetical protein [Caudoviricetes sp.]